MEEISRKRKSIEVEQQYQHLPFKVQKLNTDSVVEPLESLTKDLSKKSEDIRKDVFNGRIESLEKWIENSEAEVEIRIESIKIQFDILEEKLMQDIDKIEDLMHMDNLKSTAKNPMKKIKKLERLFKIMKKPIENTFITSKKLLEKPNAGMVYVYTPKYWDIWKALEDGHYDDIEYYISFDHNRSKIKRLFLKACEFGHLKIVRLLLNNGANVNQVLTKQQLTGVIADNSHFGRCRCGCFNYQCGGDHDDDEEEEETPLILAIYHANTANFEVLVKYGADLTFTDYFEQTVLMRAAITLESNAVQIAEILISKGADVNFKSSKSDETALSIAVESGSNDVVELLLKNNANVNARNINEQTALMRTCRAYADLKNIVELLIQYNADVNASDKTGQTALMKACENGCYDIVKVLIENGADINAEDNIKENAFIKACSGRRSDVIAKYLLENKANVNSVDSRNEAGLILTIKNFDPNTAKVIIENIDVNIDVQDKDGKPAFLLAVSSGFKNLVEALIAKNADINVKTQNGTTALMMAVMIGDDMVKLLCEHRIDINAQDNGGKTALMIACEKGRDTVVEILLFNQADVTIKDKDSKSAWDRVRVPRGNKRQLQNIFNLLMKQNIEIDAKDENGNTTLIDACKNGSGTYILRLLNKGANINEKNNQGETALIKASKNDCKGTVETLLRKGARINERDNEGCTALFRAVEIAAEKPVFVLLKAKADVNIANNQGSTVFNLVSNQTYTNASIRRMINDARKKNK